MSKELVNSPDHYNQYPIEAIEMAIKIWGEEAVKTHCEITAFKYRMRLGHKDEVETDMAKEQWYLDYAKNLKEKSE